MIFPAGVRLIIFNIHKKINGEDTDDAAGFQELNTCNVELQLISDADVVIAYRTHI